MRSQIAIRELLSLTTTTEWPLSQFVSARSDPARRLLKGTIMTYGKLPSSSASFPALRPSHSSIVTTCSLFLDDSHHGPHHLGTSVCLCLKLPVATPALLSHPPSPTGLPSRPQASGSRLTHNDFALLDYTPFNPPVPFHTHFKHITTCFTQHEVCFGLSSSVKYVTRNLRLSHR